MAGPRSERFHNRDNGILRNKYRLGRLRKDYPGLGLWRQPTNITSTSSRVSRWPRGACSPGIRCVYCKWRKHGATWPKSWKPARTDLSQQETDLLKKILRRFQAAPRSGRGPSCPWETARRPCFGAPASALSMPRPSSAKHEPGAGKLAGSSPAAPAKSISWQLIFDSHGDVELAQTRKRQRGRLATPSVGDGVGVTGAARRYARETTQRGSCLFPIGETSTFWWVSPRPVSCRTERERCSLSSQLRL